METFLRLIENVGKGVPAWLPLIFLPCVLAVIAVVLTLAGGRKYYKYIAGALGGIGFFLVACTGELTAAFVYAGLYVALAVLLRLLFFIPCPRYLSNRPRKPSSREEKIYRKFHEPLVVETNSGEKLPPKVSCYENEPAPVSATAEESGMKLTHAGELIAQLKKEELSAADRLELDVLSRSVEALGSKELTEDELYTLNDCLASVLKLTAKYKL